MALTAGGSVWSSGASRVSSSSACARTLPATASATVSLCASVTASARPCSTSAARRAAGSTSDSVWSPIAPRSRLTNAKTVGRASSLSAHVSTRSATVDATPCSAASSSAFIASGTRLRSDPRSVSSSDCTTIATRSLNASRIPPCVSSCSMSCGVSNFSPTTLPMLVASRALFFGMAPCTPRNGLCGLNSIHTATVSVRPPARLWSTTLSASSR